MLPYDRTHTGNGAGSPPQYGKGLAPFSARHMPQMPPPRSPPPMPSSASSLPGSAPRGPPTTSPFPGIRDLAGYPPRRPAGGMSISSMISGNDDAQQTQHSMHTFQVSPSNSMRPPSPGRARSSSMRESVGRGFGDLSPLRGYGAEPRPMTAVYGLERTASEQSRREGLLGSLQYGREAAHSFRAFHPTPTHSNGHVPPDRPSSQPVEQVAPIRIDDFHRRDGPPDTHLSSFRPALEPHIRPPRSETVPRHEPTSFSNGHGPTSQPIERSLMESPSADRDRHPGLGRFHAGAFGTPMREEQTGLFRPVYPPPSDRARESIETRSLNERHEIPRSSPPVSDLGSFERSRIGFSDRPMTFEEHQRMEAIHRGQQLRKESDGSGHRALLSFSPELNRRGRNSPLPQAVQGAQSRHVGPGGDNPGIKMEFGRMFSGLGSGAGSNTPTAGPNGGATPTEVSPVRHLEGGELVQTAVDEIESGGRILEKGGKSGKRNDRRSREEDERLNGRATPDMQPNKRAKTTNAAPHHHHHPGHTHHHHHHHHHHHAESDNGPSPFNMIRFPSNNSVSHSNSLTNPPHHHHHHHGHPAHHHHHPPRSGPPPRRPTTTVISQNLIDSVAKRPRKHLGSQLYQTDVSIPKVYDFTADSKIKFSSNMRSIPFLEGKENCTFTVRVPRWYLTSSSDSDEATSLEEICCRRQLWGTDVYTDDSDVVAAAIHAGWLTGDFGDYNGDIHELLDNDATDETGPSAAIPSSEAPSIMSARPRKPVKPPPGLDAHITVLVLPPLAAYASTNQNHIWSRSWKKAAHDGMSYAIHRIEFVDEGPSTRFAERSAASRKRRMAVEQESRSEAAAALLMFANGAGSAETVRVGA